MVDTRLEERAIGTVRSFPWALVSVAMLSVVLLTLVVTYQRPVDEAAEIGSLIRCPVCQGIPIADSPSPMARDMMAILRESLDAGATRREAIDTVLGAYPGSLLLEPSLSGPTLALWLVPAAAVLVGAGLALTVRRSRRGSDTATERVELEQRLSQVRGDLDDLALQVAAGEVDEEAARHLRAAYRAEMADTESALAGAAASAAPLPRSRRRVAMGAGVVVVSLALVVAAAGAFLVDRPDNVSGVGDFAEDPDAMSNETLEAVVAANADHPRIAGMRLALAERYFDEGNYSAAFPHFLEVASSEQATPIQAATALSLLGWMAYDGNAEVDTALGLLAEAQRLAPEEPFPRYLEGVVLWCGRDDVAGATGIFSTILADGVTDPEVRSRVEADLAAAENGEPCRR